MKFKKRWVLKIIQRIKDIKVFKILIFLNIFALIWGFPLLMDIIMGPDKMVIKLLYKIVHIDLKGGPPKLVYLKEILRTIKLLGANALLIEYEDMFPYEGNIANISSPYCYNRNKLRKFLKYAKQENFTIIPLVQIFGHMEYVLKLKRFKHLRENSNFTDALCPSKFQSLELVNDILKQIILFHQEIAPLKYIHIGCDEVYEINTCSECKLRGMRSIEIYMNHINIITNIVHSNSPNTTVLIWDDMMYSINPWEWQDLKIPPVEPVIWYYHNDIFKDVPRSNPAMYQKYFKTMWAAAAYKGADGFKSVEPNIFNRFTNTFKWLYFLNKYGTDLQAKRLFNFQGIILTGWSRYTHFNQVCDLLPMAIPSLISNLILIAEAEKGIVVRKYSVTDVVNIKTYQDVLKKCREYLKCNHTIQLTSEDKYFVDCKSNLAFPLYKYIEEFNLYISTRQNIRPDSHVIFAKIDKIKYAMTPYFERNFIEEYAGILFRMIKRDSK